MGAQRKGIISLACLLFLFVLFTLSACSAGNGPAQGDAPQNTVKEQAGDTGLEEEPDTEPPGAEKEIVNQLSSYAAEEYIEIYSAGDQTTVTLFDPELGVALLKAKGTGAGPEGWAELRDGIVSAAAEIAPLPDTGHVLVYVKDSEDGDIYLTVLDGVVSYDVFDGSEPVVYNAPTISLSEFNQIVTGMTYDEVVEIVGGPGQVLSQTDLGIGAEYATVMYMWEGEGMLGANANVMFQGGEVYSKAQFGLE